MSKNIIEKFNNLVQKIDKDIENIDAGIASDSKLLEGKTVEKKIDISKLKKNCISDINNFKNKIKNINKLIEINEKSKGNLSDECYENLIGSYVKDKETLDSQMISTEALYERNKSKVIEVFNQLKKEVKANSRALEKDKKISIASKNDLVASICLIEEKIKDIKTAGYSIDAGTDEEKVVLKQDDIEIGKNIATKTSIVASETKKTRKTTRTKGNTKKAK